MRFEAGEEQGDVASDVSARAFRLACIAILTVAALVRLWGLDQLPPGLFCDEAGNGYNAFSLLESGRDEEGRFLPLYIWSFGVSYKNPVFVYSAIPVVGLFGLSEATIRLTAALWGILGVAAMLWLGTAMSGRRGGLWSGLFVALCPWHVHFSRIAFELIALLPLFAAGLALFLQGVRGRPRRLVPAAFLFAASLYAYAPAKMFVPLFLAGAALVYRRAIVAAGRWAVLAAGAAIVTGMPLLVFDLLHRDRAGQYFSETTILSAARPLLENLRLVAANWRAFFSLDFLFRYGDPLVRHSVPEVGQIFFVMAPLIALGVLWSLRRGRPQGKLLLWWLLLFPLAPSLMNEAPSATRGFIGVGALCLLAGAGMSALQGTIAGEGRRAWRQWATDIAVCLVAATLLFEAARFGYRYVAVYPAAAANAFQYGYGEAIAAMEPLRDQFDVLLLTTSEGNQAQVFPLFYNEYPPEKWLESYNPGYLVIDPAEFDRYDPARQRVLAALRESDLRLFDEFAVRQRVVDPAGRQVFVVGEIVERGRYLRNWLMLGVFDNSDGAAQRENHFPGGRPSLDARRVGGRDVYWRRVLPHFVRVELHHFFRSMIEPSGQEPVWVCAYATTDLVAATDVAVELELDGTNQWIEAWLDGEPLVQGARQIGPRSTIWQLALERGSNQLLLKTCRGHADWSFTARLRGVQGGKAPGVVAHPRIRRESGAAAAAPPAPRQIVSGFARVLSFSHELAGDGDYRGDSAGWIEHLYDADGAVEWATAAPPSAAPTALVFTAVVSPLPGRAQLWVDGRFALEFETARFTDAQRWRGNGFELRYEPRQGAEYRSGVWVLLVPGEHVEAGRPLRLRVSHVDGHRDASFMLKGRADTAEYEKLTVADIESEP
jgi:4-amino-4-deoxy-L-arabinose transferase-like glycosyltransferase